MYDDNLKLHVVENSASRDGNSIFITELDYSQKHRIVEHELETSFCQVIDAFIKDAVWETNFSTRDRFLVSENGEYTGINTGGDYFFLSERTLAAISLFSSMACFNVEYDNESVLKSLANMSLLKLTGNPAKPFTYTCGVNGKVGEYICINTKTIQRILAPSPIYQEMENIGNIMKKFIMKELANV